MIQLRNNHNTPLPFKLDIGDIFNSRGSVFFVLGAGDKGLQGSIQVLNLGTCKKIEYSISGWSLNDTYIISRLDP